MHVALRKSVLEGRMLGFKKSVTPDEFGQAVLSCANDLIVADASRSLGERFDNCDASKGWIPVFQAHGVPIPIVKLYRLYYTHSVLQTHFRSFSVTHRKEMTRGAMANILTKPASYDFEKIFSDLEATFDGLYKFDASVDPLRNPEARPMSGVSTAKYLVNGFVFLNMENRQAFVDDFVNFSSTVCSTTATVHRATELLLTKFKIIG